MVLLVTYTVRHHWADDLKGTLGGLLDARKRLLSGRWAKGFTARFGIAGRIRALEVTHGENGWHPHVHELVFLERDVDRAAFLTELREQWSGQVLKAGLKSVNSHGVDVRFADLSVADYVSKFGRERTWGPEHELTKSAAKVGKQGNRGPIGLLSDYFAGDDRAGALWREYAQVFKGSRQLVWSEGLRNLVGRGQEQSDAESAGELREEAQLLDELSREEWRVVLGNDARAELLQVLGSGSVAQLRVFLGALGVKRSTESFSQDGEDLTGFQSVEFGGFAVSSSGGFADSVGEFPGGIDDGFPFCKSLVVQSLLSGSIGSLAGSIGAVDPGAGHREDSVTIKLRYRASPCLTGLPL